MYKVLLVDDEILVRDAIRENMHWEELGYELVNDCANGKEAKEYIEEHPVDVVLTDICMPYMDGMELSEFLYEKHPNVSIIIFSGFEEFEYAKKAIKYKVAEYILKPVTARELSGVLTKVKGKLDERKQQEEKVNQLSRGYDSYKKNRSLILSKGLSRLVLGTQDTKQSLLELREMGVSLEAAYYRVVMVGINLYSDLLEMDEAVKKQSVLMAFAVENICDELIHNDGLGMAFQDGDNRVCLLIQTNRKKEAMEATEKLCKRIQESVKQLMGLTVCCGIGTYVKDVSMLSDSYRDAMGALGYRYLFGETMILDMEAVRERLNQPITIEQELEAISLAVKACDEQKVAKSFATIEKKIKEGYTGKYRSYMYLQQTVRCIHDVLEEIAEEERQEEKREQVLKKIAESVSFDEMKQAILTYASQVIEILCNMKCSTAKRQASLALDYIKRNYSDPELSLNAICSYLNVSTSHFSNIFKEEMGATFMEVLIGMRMEKAKELLQQTTLKNYEIAERVGFSDPHYFSISFKKMTGMTPQKYAKGKR